MTLEDLTTMLTDIAAALAALTSRIERLEAQAKPPHLTDLMFDKFWELYPRKVEKAAASRAWAVLSMADKAAAAAGVVVYAGIWKTAPVERCAFIKHPASWLRARSWEDGEAEWRKVAQSRAPARPLIGAHHEAPTSKCIDLDTAPSAVREVFELYRTKQTTTPEQDALYAAWETEALNAL